MKNTEIINKTIKFVQKQLEGAEGGHDWWHIYRVWQNAKLIALEEVGVNLFIIELGALLHDIADSKFHNGDEEIGPRKAKEYLNKLSLSEDDINHIDLIIRNMSYKNSLDKNDFYSLEMGIVQDADRLDAIGAIGIARAFNYGGYKNRSLYNPNISPHLHMTKEEYKKSTAPTINHFYEKLLLLKDMMNTESGKRIAEERHAFMETYLQQFYQEWNGIK